VHDAVVVDDFRHRGTNARLVVFPAIIAPEKFVV
jgi:hypothetical protein